MITLYCATRQGGGYWGMWRHGQGQAAWEGTLDALKKGCEGVPTDACPFRVQEPTFVKVNALDATPLVRDTAYCRESKQQPKTTCPVRAEGDPFRLACELKAMGGELTYWLSEVTGDLSIKRVYHDGFKVELQGRGTAVLNCTFPTANGAQKCRTATGEPIRVSR